ncbi:signal transduction histidine kinase [Bradyrhizobium sp. YR681]|uniref:sensor histidine kinase n=1 Tax=Bradyrhizobium sp. YR681 TaxID=1144344 RepID=UPI00026F7451|nr:ATP-binding protein [Bradyrhizobium sp. YR681]EJN10759.1 signal transduction histidine kinase [Bradyrhizobium sp. YR681]
MATFEVDTKLFGELGELLVGRDSTALVELIKNAYDADASKVEILGRNLSEPEKGEIIIADDGVGMDAEDFSRGFLRIAGRTKTEADRRSPWFKRRYTGEKGIGRLAAHKLARQLSVVSRKWDGRGRDKVKSFVAGSGVKATIDWERIEKLETLADVAKSRAIQVDPLPRSELTNRSSGTRLNLSRLRKPWTQQTLNSFFEEVATLTPPPLVTAPLPPGLIKERSILPEITIRDARKEAGFEIVFAGDLSLHELELAAVPQSANWIIEIDCDADARYLTILVAPTKAGLAETPNAEAFKLKKKLPEAMAIVGFQARIFQKQNSAWPRSLIGVRVYYEGFRVLPYGDISSYDDWLELDRDYRSRGKGELGRLRQYAKWNLPEGTDREGLVLQGNRQFSGAVFLTRENAQDLKILVNREGFLPGPQFSFIREMTRLGIDLQIRQNSAARGEVQHARKVDQLRQQRAVERADASAPPSAFLLTSLQDSALDSLKDVRAAISRGDVRAARATLDNVEKSLQSAKEFSEETASEATMYRVLASMGLEQAAFVHEVNAIAILAQGVAQALDAIVKELKDQKLSRRLSGIAAEARSIRERLRRNAIYLTDMTGVEGRRRRSRQDLLERFSKVAEFYQPSILKQRIELVVDIPKGLRTSPMFPAEVSAIFTNLLSNAIKFAGAGGAIRAAGEKRDGELIFKLENTGEPVDLSSANRWFEPFRSTTVEIDEALGQGMGLGLTVTRSLLDEYGSTIEFVRPSKSFATALEIRMPSK